MPDVALIDVVIPQIDGLELSKRLSKQFPALKIVLKGTMPIEECMRQELLDEGIICDIFPVPFERQDLIDMAKDCVNGLDHR